jgi:hypothetical protein
VGSREHSNEPVTVIKGKEFVEELSGFVSQEGLCCMELALYPHEQNLHETQLLKESSCLKFNYQSNMKQF